MEGQHIPSPEDLDRLSRLAGHLDATFGEGFLLVALQHNGACTLHVSNLEPRNLLAMLKVEVARLEGQTLTPGHA